MLRPRRNSSDAAAYCVQARTEAKGLAFNDCLCRCIHFALSCRDLLFGGKAAGFFQSLREKMPAARELGATITFPNVGPGRYLKLKIIARR
jgi:hypothetical protein